MVNYYRPTSRAEAVAALAEEGEGARVLVGGTDLLVGLRHHTVEPTLLVDIKAVEDLPPPLVVTDEGVRIGPTLTMGALAAHPRLREWYPALVEAALTVGSVAIRNRASLIGNVTHASPAADTAPPLLVHGAVVTIESVGGERQISLSEFFLGPRATRCSAGELVTRIDLPRPAEGHGSAFVRLTRRRGVDLATVSVAAGVHRDGRVELGLGAVGPRPLLTEVVEPVDLAGEAGLVRALDTTLSVATPIADVRASKEYRLAMVRVLAKRAVLAARDRRTPKESKEMAS
ncbi:FAD binding domain-containing protein [Streptomyces sp. NPDC060065]|uniref:FAD binding domain-containing protein n=1 Tax=Streptomyces sp. NPDC060065 TaxID=3347050 RepID=UPI0036CE6CE2